VLSDEKGQVQRRQADREDDQKDIQIRGEAVDAAPPFPAWGGAIARRWFSQHCQHRLGMKSGGSGAAVINFRRLRLR
jgi:hypothetical protein